MRGWGPVHDTTRYYPPTPRPNNGKVLKNCRSNTSVSAAVAALQQRPHRPHNHSRQRPHRPHNHSRAAECSLDPFSHPHIPTFFRTFFLSSSHVSVCQLQAPLSLVHTSVWVRQRKWSIQEVWNFSSNFNQQFISAIMSVSFMSSVSSIIHHSSFSTLSIHQEFISSLSIHHHSSSHHSSSFIIHSDVVSM